MNQATSNRWRVDAAWSPLVRTVDWSRAAGVVGLVGFVVAWYLVAAVLAAPSLVPFPHVVIDRALSWFLSARELSAYGLESSGLGPNLAYTIENVLIAVGIGTLVGTLLGLASAGSAVFRAILNPIVSGATAIPFLVMAPFFLVWFGVGRTSGLLLVTLYTSVILVIFSQRAVLNLNPVYESNAMALGASHRAIIVDVLVPATIPEVLGGLRIALAGAWGLETVAELLGSNKGVGVIIRVVEGQADVVGIMATVATIALVAVLFDGMIVLTSRTVLRWRVAS